MGIILWIIFGAVVGWVASLLMNTDAQQGPVLGGWLMSLFGESGVGGFTLYSFLVALLGACVLIALLKAFR
jgi:uncharacterized membrane protein YeaQ/YmgE (transglycosylase-associated protein family)